MKKKLVVAAVVAILVAMDASAQGLKRYNDWANGYSGDSEATYYSQGFSQSLALQSRQNGIKYGAVITEYSKLSKEDNFLLWSALNEYDLRDGECYVVTLYSDNTNRTSSLWGCMTAITLWVTIKNNGNSCTIHDMFRSDIKKRF